MPDPCRGHCTVQVYDVSPGPGTNIAKSPPDACPDLTPAEIKACLRKTMPDNVLTECVPASTNGTKCLCKAHKVADDDPSWSEPADVPLVGSVTCTKNVPGKKTRQAEEEEKEGVVVPPPPPIVCTYTISGTVQLRSRIDDKAICLPDKITIQPQPHK
jgi:hypothetical protein